MIRNHYYKALSPLFLVLLCVGTAMPQTTEFTFQGSLKDGANPANGNYDFEFRLFGTVSGGTAIGTLQHPNVPVVDGAFSVNLDFGAQFPGDNRFIGVSVRRAGDGPFTALTPRQPVNSSPYSIKSATAENANTSGNSLQLGGVSANQYVLTTDPRLSNARTPTAGSSNYIQNTLVPQAASFRITGEANIGGGLRIGAPSSPQAKLDVFGSTGCATVIFGWGIPKGLNCQQVLALTTNDNSVPLLSGYNSIGPVFRFFGSGSFGAQGDVGIGTFSPAAKLHVTAAGIMRARFNSDSNAGISLTLNEQPGWSVATVTGGQFQIFNDSILQNAVWINAANNNLGIGVASPTFKLQVEDAGNSGLRVQTNTAGGTVASFGGNGAFQIDGSGVPGGRFTILHNGRVGIGTNNPTRPLEVTGIVAFNLASGGATSVCQNFNSEISTCSSSIRYKENIRVFDHGLDLVSRLKPVTFDWKAGGRRDIGFVAEDVASVDPLLVTFNEDGQIEGVKYDRISVVLINAVKEQQTEIERLKAEIESLKLLVCAANRNADICRR
ncbi:MAG: tail fiber domain-containing protein [Acidobacteriota bacterium]|nr:MAG: tail fiber domain-containing protein [Acidobacteriota bacterium]